MIIFTFDYEEQTIYIDNDKGDRLEEMGVSFDTEIENGLGSKELLFACQKWLDEKEMYDTEYKVLIRIH